MLYITGGVFMNPNILEVGNNIENLVHFEWNITNYCNFDCYYCSVARTMKEDPIPNNQTKSYKLVLAKLKNVKSKFIVDLAGGEPTLHNDFIDIVTALNNMENCTSITLSTNFTGKLPFFKQLKESKIKKLDVGISYHPQYHKIYMKNLDKIKFVAENFLHNINVIISDDPQYWKDTLEFTNTMHSYGIDYVVTILHGTENYWPDYALEEMQEQFKEVFEYTRQQDLIKNTFRYKFKDGTEEWLTHDEILARKLDELKGIKCDSYYYTIDMVGDIYRICTGEKLGLRTDNLEVTIKCPHEICNCETRIFLNKYNED